jgi:hypothetical protein
MFEPNDRLSHPHCNPIQQTFKGMIGILVLGQIRDVFFDGAQWTKPLLTAGRRGTLPNAHVGRHSGHTMAHLFKQSDGEMSTLRLPLPPFTFLEVWNIFTEKLLT